MAVRLGDEAAQLKVAEACETEPSITVAHLLHMARFCAYHSSGPGPCASPSAQRALLEAALRTLLADTRNPDYTAIASVPFIPESCAGPEKGFLRECLSLSPRCMPGNCNPDT